MRRILEFLFTKEERDSDNKASKIWNEIIMSLCAMEKDKGKALKDLI